MESIFKFFKIETLKFLSNFIKKNDPDQGLQHYYDAQDYYRKALLARSSSDSVETGSNTEHIQEYDILMNRERAAIELREAIRCGLPGEEEWFNAAKFAEELEQYRYAVKAYQVVARRSAYLREKANLCLAELEARQGNNIEARKIAFKVLHRNPDNEEAKRLIHELCNIDKISVKGD